LLWRAGDRKGEEKGSDAGDEGKDAKSMSPRDAEPPGGREGKKRDFISCSNRI